MDLKVTHDPRPSAFGRRRHIFLNNNIFTPAQFRDAKSRQDSGGARARVECLLITAIVKN